MNTSEYVVRNTKGTIDTHKSIHAFAMAIGRKVQEEQALKNNKVYRKMIRGLFKETGADTLTKPFILGMALRKLNATADNWRQIQKDVEEHIRLNKGVYLRIRPGFAGGVQLLTKGQKS